MKLLSYTRDGRPGYGVVVEDGVIDLAGLLGARCPDLKALLAADALGEAARLAKSGRPDFALDSIEFAPVIPNPGNIFCVGLNYEEHRVEAGRERTDHPAIFTRCAASQVGHRRPLLLPRESTKLDYEGEIAVVIGRGGRRIRRGDAMAHVAGYACYNDGSIRDWQRHTTQWTPGKNFAATGGFGPWLVTRDELPDDRVLELTTRLNGEVVQHADTQMMIFTIPVVIEYLSAFAPLAPGDVIATGTPGGVGFKRTPPLFMKAGDVVEVEVSGVGTLVNTIAQD